MRIFIAGSGGFLGRNFKRYFSSCPDFDVSFLSRSDFDLSDPYLFSEYCKIHKPDLLIHVAVSLSDFANNIRLYLALEQCAPYCGKIIMIGSGAEYSHQRYKPLMDESYYAYDKPPTNNNVYHASKHLISRLHANTYASNIYNFRVFGLYGPYEDYTRRLISNNIFNFLESGYMHASANHAFDYLYVDDLISAILHFFGSSDSPKYNTYNVCSGRSDRFFDILKEVIISLGGVESSINMDSFKPTDLVYSGDNSLFESEFGYTISQTSYAESALTIKSWLTTEVL